MSRNQPRGPCSFCGKNQDQVQRIIGGPGQVSICDECVRRFAGEKHEVRCSFCGKAQSQTQYFRHGPGRVGICNECLALAQQIIADQESITQRPAQPGGVEDGNIPS